MSSLNLSLINSVSDSLSAAISPQLYGDEVMSNEMVNKYTRPGSAAGGELFATRCFLGVDAFFVEQMFRLSDEAFEMVTFAQDSEHEDVCSYSPLEVIEWLQTAPAEINIVDIKPRVLEAAWTDIASAVTQ